MSLVGHAVEQPILEADGKGYLSLVNRSVNVLNKAIPEPCDYTLEKLLNSNVPLQSVSATLDDNPTVSNIESFVNNKLKVDNNEN